VILSLNEIETTIRRAATGTGWAFGLAEDAGRAAAWLAAQGMDGVGAAVRALAPGPGPVQAERMGNDCVLRGGRAASAGPAAIDLLGLPGVRRVTLEAIDEVLLIVGLVGEAADGTDYTLGARGFEARVSGGGATLSGTIPESPATLTLTRAEGGAPSELAATSGVAIDEAVWARAKALAALSYVPASAESRERGAGAGRIDND